MVFLSSLDILVIILFGLIVLIIGFIPKYTNNKIDYLLSGRNLGLFLFILVNVATWYGGILGIGEFTYQYGLLSWITQGLPYYIFAIIFALTLAPKISKASLTTIPEKVDAEYGKTPAIIASILVFILVSPAPYLLMLANIIMIIGNFDLFTALLISALISSAYLFKGGFKADIFTNAFQFFIMFIGFGILLFFSYNHSGNFQFLINNLPKSHLNPLSTVSISYILVWFLIALWTFADPGFHQRCNAAKNARVAKYGILLSVLFWFIFDFLTNVSGLYAKVILPNLENPVMSFPLLAENVLPSGYKGVFYAAMFATVLSTLNSFLFLSATTFGNDIIPKLFKEKFYNITFLTRVGLVISILISMILAYYVQSVIELWFYIGSICIPSLIIVIISSYYIKLKVNSTYIILEMIIGFIVSTMFFIFKFFKIGGNLFQVTEPMLAGLFIVFVIHVFGLIKGKFLQKNLPLI